MRQFMVAIVLFSVFCGSLAARAQGTPDAGDKRPNVIWIVLDALRADSLSCHGYARRTSPNMDALAARGVRAAHHFTQGLWTTVSVPSYMTGRYFPVMVHESVEGTEVARKCPPDELLAPEIFRANGYHTAMITSHPWFTPRSRLWQAFDEAIFERPDERDRAYYASFATLNRRIFQWLTNTPRQPFFLYIHTLDTHFPHILDAPYDLWIDPDFTSEQIQNGTPVSKYECRFSPEERRHLEGLYDGSILYSDHQLGLLFWKLETLGLFDDAVIVIGSDHGDLLGEDGIRWGHVPASYDLLMRVPFILAGPGVPPGRVVNDITENVDIVPTLVDLLHLETNAAFDGRSILPLLREEGKPEGRQFALSKYVGGGYDGKPGLILRSRDFKYEWDMHNEREYLWPVPDVFPTRPNVIQEYPDAAATLKRYVEREILPKWEAYRALPERVVVLFIHDTIATNAFPQEALAIHRNADFNNYLRDDKWAYDTDWRRLWTRAWLETPPPLTFRYEVPPARYRVQIRMFCMSDYLDHPASAFAVRLRGDEDFSLVKKDDCAVGHHTYLFVDAGIYETDDGIFEITLKPGTDNHWAVMNGFRLIRFEQGEEIPEAPSDEDINARFEQLRALGYVE